MYLRKSVFFSLLAAGSLLNATASADTGNTQPSARLVVENVVVLDQLPTEVRSGSIRISNDAPVTLANQAGISAAAAGETALTALPGKIIEIKLDDENDFLVWEVEVVDSQGQITELMIDAGDGRLLAADQETEHDSEDEDGSHSWWKFWEDDDQDEHQDRD